jgi:hypothetical protein
MGIPCKKRAASLTNFRPSSAAGLAHFLSIDYHQIDNFIQKAPFALSLSKGERFCSGFSAGSPFMVRQAHHERSGN